MRKATWLTISSLAILTVAGGGQAQELNPTLTDRVQLFGGAWFTNKDESVTVTDDDGTRVKLDFQGLGFDDSETVPAFGGILRLNRRWRLDVFASGVENSTRITLPDGLPPVGGDRIDPGESVDAEFNVDFVAARVGFAFVANDTAELGVALGAAFIDAEASASTSRERFAVSESGAVPTLGLFGTLALSPRWALRGHVSAFSIEQFGSIDEGKLFDVSGAITYRPFRNVGFGLAYHYIDGDVEADRRNGEIEVDWTTQGPMAFVELGFGSTR